MSRRPQPVPSPWQVAKMFHEFRKARAALLELDPTLADDLKLQLDYLEGQTDAFEALDTLVEASVDARMLRRQRGNRRRQWRRVRRGLSGARRSFAAGF